MAKDPAFLFYSQDFLVGTMAMPFEERGRYITLLCYMHQNGPISEETIRLLVGSFSDILRLKFLQNESGLFYNNRLSIEVEKRAKFTESRVLNGNKGGRPKKQKPKENLINNLNKTDRLLIAKPKENLIEDENAIEINNELDSDIFISKPNLKIAFDGFVKMRKEIKKPLTGNAIQLIKNKVWKLADHNEDAAIEILNNSTMGCWQGVFALRPEIKANNQVEKESKFSKAVKGTDTYIQQKYATANKQ